MPQRLEQIPESLNYLVPEMAKETIVIGSTAYVIVPLATGELEGIMQTVSEVMLVIVKDILESTEALRNGAAQASGEAHEFLGAMQKGLNKIVADGSINKIVSLTTGIDEETIKAEATLPQLHHFAAAFWKQNLDFSNASDGTEKNFTRLLEMMGFGQSESRVYQWAEATMLVLPDTKHGSPAKRIDTVQQIAFELGLLKKAPVRIEGASSPESEYTPTSPDA